MFIGECLKTRWNRVKIGSLFSELWRRISWKISVPCTAAVSASGRSFNDSLSSLISDLFVWGVFYEKLPFRSKFYTILPAFSCFEELSITFTSNCFRLGFLNDIGLLYVIFDVVVLPVSSNFLVSHHFRWNGIGT